MMHLDFTNTAPAVLNFTMLMLIITVTMIVVEQTIAVMMQTTVVEGQTRVAIYQNPTLMITVIGPRMTAAVFATAPT
jgi:hypothetical protein